MIISQEHDLSEMAKPLHNLTAEQIRAMAKDAGEILGTDLPVRVSERGTRVCVDYKKDGRKVTLFPAEIGNEIKTGQQLADALTAEWNSRQRSRDYVAGKVDGSVFEGKYIPPETDGIEGLEFVDGPNKDDDHNDDYEEDKSC